MKFGLSLTGHLPISEEADVARIAELSGFDYVWSWDNQVLGRDAYVLLTLAAEQTTRVKLGTCVTNPITRDPTVLASVFATLNDHTDGRMVCGIGRGDSAVRMQKTKPSNLAAVEEAIGIIRELGSGRPARVGAQDMQLNWAAERELPVYLAAYGPKALSLAGRVADGVILQVADPAVVEWCLGFVHSAAEAAGRDPGSIEVQCAAPLLFGDDLADMRETVRWFPAVVGNHVADVLRHHQPEALPRVLTDYVQHRTHYDYNDHTRPGSDHAAYVPDEIVDRFTVIGSVDRCVERLRELESIGVTQFNVYIKVAQPAELVRAIGDQLVRQVPEPASGSVERA